MVLNERFEPVVSRPQLPDTYTASLLRGWARQRTEFSREITANGVIDERQFHFGGEIDHRPLQLEQPLPHRDQKDPCIYHDPTTDQHHIYLTHGSSLTEQWEVWRITADQPDGVFGNGKVVNLEKPPGLQEPHQICAVSLYWDESTQRHHLISQTHCFATGGFIGLWESVDGVDFSFVKPVIEPSLTDRSHLGVYDPHIQIDAAGKRHIFYTAIEQVGRGEIYEAVADELSPTGYRQVDKVLAPEQLPFQNLVDDPDCSPADYEWCPEGIQVLDVTGNGLSSELLPNIHGRRLMIGVGFLKGVQAAKGTRQRLFLAIEGADGFEFLGILPITQQDESGHASMQIVNDQLYIYYQDRDRHGGWQLRIAKLALTELDQQFTV